MKINFQKYELARARACMTSSDVSRDSGINRNTLNTCLRRGNCNAATIGKIAKALGVDVLDIIETEESS